MQQQSERYKIFVKNRTHYLETCFQTQLSGSYKQENMEIALFKRQQSFPIFLD